MHASHYRSVDVALVELDELEGRIRALLLVCRECSYGSAKIRQRK